MAKNFPFHRQLDAMDCGPTCLRMIAEWHGRRYSLQQLRERSYIDREGVSVRGISEAAESIGFRTMAIKIPFQSPDPEEPDFFDVPQPCIVHWEQNHFVVVYKTDEKHVWIADPRVGKNKLTHAEFKRKWIATGESGIALLLETTPEFYAQEGEEIKRQGLGFLLRYTRPFRGLMWQLVIGLLVASVIQLIFPFLTQSIVDIGIKNQDIDFIWLILMAQLMLFLSQTSVQFIQSWILLHIGTRVNISMISDFLIKLMKLPISFFDSKMIGDLLQRINDHRRIEELLTTSSLNILFSTFNLIIFSAVLIVFNLNIFLIFFISSCLYFIWIKAWLKKRKNIDYALFKERAENHSALIELIQGMQEIKLQNSERKHRWKWASIQARLFQANVRSLRITQYQDAGATFITQAKDIIITFIAAKAVVEGQMTLGMLLAVQYIVGQLNGPLVQFIQFIRKAQDAEISMERLGEIHDLDNEEKSTGTAAQATTITNMNMLPEGGDLNMENLSFRYNALSDYVLKDIDLTIPNGKVTAIVGRSGSGKTTLVKLLLGFYDATEGSVRLGGIHTKNIARRLWRSECGAVMQDGFIFSDTIANNIAESESNHARGINRERLLKAVKTAHIQEFVENMPLGYNTMIGPKGNGISQGQKQRLLIARAVYKDPQFLYFDEATNALDAHNEKIIMSNLDEFFSGRTVVVVAHRLSTVKNADQIVVLEMGRIVEKGTHAELTAKRGAYYNLVKNQLELGS